MALSAREKKTYADYLKLPDYPRVELIDGEFYMSPAPNANHQRLIPWIHRFLFDWVESHGLGEVFLSPFDVYFSNHNVVQPDVLFISKERQGILTEPNVQGAPDLAIEILSPSNKANDIIRKKSLYENFDVKEYWIVDPEKRIVQVFVLKDRKFELQSFQDKIKSTVVSGFEIHPDEIFRVMK